MLTQILPYGIRRPQWVNVEAEPWWCIYHQTSNISHTFVVNKIVDHSDITGAAPTSSLHYVITMPANDLTPDGARPSADTVMTEKVGIFLPIFFGALWHCITLVNQVMSFKIANKMSRNLVALQWKPRVVMMPTLSSLVALQVVVTTCSATSDDKVGIMTTLTFWCFECWCRALVHVSWPPAHISYDHDVQY